MKIKAYTSFYNKTKTHYYNDFYLKEELPKINDVYYEDDSQIDIIKDVKEVKLDCEQVNDDVYNYDYYELIIESKNKDDNSTYKYSEYICIRKVEY